MLRQHNARAVVAELQVLRVARWPPTKFHLLLPVLMSWRLLLCAVTPEKWALISINCAVLGRQDESRVKMFSAPVAEALVQWLQRCHLIRCLQRPRINRRL